MSFELRNPRNPVLFTWWGMIISAAFYFGIYLLVQKFLFGTEINNRIMITGSSCSVIFVLIMYFMYRNGKKKQENKDAADQ